MSSQEPLSGCHDQGAGLRAFSFFHECHAYGSNLQGIPKLEEHLVGTIDVASAAAFHLATLSSLSQGSQ